MNDRNGVVLLQLGGPESVRDVRPFLYNFFVDLIPDNIPVPQPLVRPTAWLLSLWRASRSRRLYASIGGSPLRFQTHLQAWALRSELQRRGRRMPVYVAMRNWRPFTQDALRAAQADGVERIVAVPLYPQYSFSTTRSSLNELQRAISVSHYQPALAVVEQYCEDPKYVASLADLTARYLRSFAAPVGQVHLIFSAHGLPLSYIERGDPYEEQVERTMHAVLELLDHQGPSHLSFQSRLGPAKWLEPSTEKLIEELGREGAKAICIVPVAFVSEHLETLHEIDIEYAGLARRSGIDEFQRVCALKCHPTFIASLADQVEEALAKSG